jgi:hypothetical protein
MQALVLGNPTPAPEALKAFIIFYIGSLSLEWAYDPFGGEPSGMGLNRNRLFRLLPRLSVRLTRYPALARHTAECAASGAELYLVDAEGPGAGEDQHADDDTALPGTRRHDRYDGQASPVISKMLVSGAGSSGWR